MKQTFSAYAYQNGNKNAFPKVGRSRAHLNTEIRFYSSKRVTPMAKPVTSKIK